MENRELKPCPFCDGTAILIQNPSVLGKTSYYVSCIECGNRTKLFKSTKTAEKKWNRRINDGAITISRAEMDALNEYEEKIKIDEAETADVVEVVRCKDCKHCSIIYPYKRKGEEAREAYYCGRCVRFVKPSEYCSFGEMKEK